MVATQPLPNGKSPQAKNLLLVFSQKKLSGVVRSEEIRVGHA
jgi:hypothetical protein